MTSTGRLNRVAAALLLAGVMVPAAALRVPEGVPVQADVAPAPAVASSKAAPAPPARASRYAAKKAAAKTLGRAAPTTMARAPVASPQRAAANKTAAVALAGGATAAAAAAVAAPAVAPLSAPARAMRQWIVTTGDNEGASFAVIDKRQARLWIFEADGRVAASTPVLLGAAAGDVSVPGIGERPIKDILPHERTTPAGRFLAEPGHNASGEDIIWVDYDAAVSMHRVRASNVAERRLQRLASRTPADNRISYGCINVPAAFYDRHLHTRVQQSRAVIYLLPETRPLEALFKTADGVTPRRVAQGAAPLRTAQAKTPKPL